MVCALPLYSTVPLFAGSFISLPEPFLIRPLEEKIRLPLFVNIPVTVRSFVPLKVTFEVLSERVKSAVLIVPLEIFG